MSNSFNQPPAGKEDILAIGYNIDKEVVGKYYISRKGCSWFMDKSDLSKYTIETQLSLLGKSNKIHPKKCR
jgi:hypothetical protein